MIIDKTENIGRYAGLSDNFKKAADFISKTDLKTMSLGRYEIDGDKVFANVMEYKIAKNNEGGECHKKYSDIQIILEGEEGFGWGYTASIGEYNAENDIAPCTNAKDFVFNIKSGEFVIFLPDEVHCPGNMPNNQEVKVKKMVIKVAK